MDLPKVHWRPGWLARHGASLFVWMALRAVMQAATVLVLARQLGAQPYGQFVAVIAVVSFFTPFVGMGLSHMVLRNVARDPARESIYFGRAVRCWVCTLLPCTAVATVIAMLLLPSGLPLISIAVVTIAELAATSLTELRARHRQAQQKINIYGAINAGLPGIRLLVFGLLFLTGQDLDIEVVLWAYAISSLLYALLLWRPIPAEISFSDEPTSEPMTARNGLPFCLAAFAMKLQAEFNKPALAYTGFGLAGTYNIAQRAVEMASLPLLALQESLWPRLYAQQNPMQQMRRTGLVLFVLALVLGGVMWLAAPLLLCILGDSFSEAVEVLRALAWLPLLQVLRALLNFHAIHHGRMTSIGWIYAVGATVSVASVAIFVPMYGMAGAVVASYVAEVAIIFFLMRGALLPGR